MALVYLKGENMKKLTVTPKNPRQFVSFCFGLLKSHPHLKNEDSLIVKVLEYKHYGLFYCAYGYFWVQKDRKVISLEFHVDKVSAKKFFKTLPT